jgi:hypothetical protein
MKLIIVLIAILRASLGNICPQKFYNIYKSYKQFTGYESYLKPNQNFPNTDDWIPLHNLIIQNNIEPGVITFEITKNAKEDASIARLYNLSSNLVCREIKTDKTKTTETAIKCLLQLITVESKVLLFFEISFQYDVPKKENDDQCKAKLNALISARTFEIEENDYFRIFSIPVIRKKDGRELKLKFNARAQLLWWMVKELIKKS